jgi:hypothetical protein
MATGLATLIRHPARIGAIFAVASLPLHWWLPLPASQQLAALVLGLVAGIYVGFAVVDGRLATFGIEAAVAAAFLAAAVAGLWVSPWLVPAAYAVHGLWDMAHHRHVSTAMPRWYIPFCAVFDWTFAAGLAAIWIAA